MPRPGGGEAVGPLRLGDAIADLVNFVGDPVSGEEEAAQHPAQIVMLGECRFVVRPVLLPELFVDDISVHRLGDGGVGAHGIVPARGPDPRSKERSIASMQQPIGTPPGLGIFSTLRW